MSAAEFLSFFLSFFFLLKLENVLLLVFYLFSILLRLFNLNKTS